MTREDSIFGVLSFDHGWSGVINIEFFGRNTQIDLLIDGEKDSPFDEGQYTAYETLMENWAEIQLGLLNAIFSYYNQKRCELGYDRERNKDYPLIETADQLLNMIRLDGMVIPYADIFYERHIGILLHCTWDDENGLGLRLLNEKVTEAGDQDVAI